MFFYDFKWIRCIIDILVFVDRSKLFLELIQLATQHQLKWVVHEHCHICMLINGMRRLTFPQKENNIY